MLNIKNLTISLRDDDRVILKDFDFVLNDGDKVGLIGEEGNGKSLLLKAIVNRKAIEGYCDISGDIFNNNDIIAYLPQSLVEKYYNYTTNEYFYKKVDLNLLDYNNLYRCISDFDLSEDILSDKIKMKNLSGGEKIKFMLLIEILKNPTIFLFDEPSNDLDYNSMIWLENFMKELDIPLIFVSHDRKLLSNVANRIIHLEQIKRRTEAKHTISNNSYEDYVKKRENFIDTEINKANKDREEFDKKLGKYKKVHDSVEHSLRSTINDV